MDYELLLGTARSISGEGTWATLIFDWCADALCSLGRETADLAHKYFARGQGICAP
jgi:hypothetical protein